ncbi:hypothetical protein OR1_00147 [Geobacter sp. OR-1]|nr:hypothetical protein OR1_00147 [Geobacter sp. OR-1]
MVGKDRFHVRLRCGIVRNKGVTPADLRTVERLVYEHAALLKEKWNEFHGTKR